MAKEIKIGSGIIKRALVDNALDNLSANLRKDEIKVRHNINVAWNSYAEALATAGKAKSELDRTAEKNLKNKLNQIDVDHQKLAAAGKGSFEQSEQKREKARQEYKRELEHNQENFDRDAREAAEEFRRQTGEAIEAFTTDIGITVDNFRAAHP
jgi:hypothetical protein